MSDLSEDQLMNYRRHGQQMPYYWIIANHNGRPLIIGPKTSEEEAYRLGFEKLGGVFTVEALNTRDKNRAVAILKARKIEQSDNLDIALEKFSRKI